MPEFFDRWGTAILLIALIISSWMVLTLDPPPVERQPEAYAPLDPCYTCPARP